MKTTRRALLGLLAIFCGAAALRAESEPARAKAEHVVLMVWDGMRPDFVTEANAPTLWKLAREGVTFRNHHSVYPTLTSVNAAALATGVHPGRSGPIGNYEFRPEIDRAKDVRMDALDTIRATDAATGGKYLAVPTIVELVQASGGRTAVAGTKTAPFLFDRKPGAIALVSGQTFPEAARAAIEKLLGPYPAEELPCAAQDKWTTRALTESLWKDGVPEFSVLWMGDPDRSQHATEPGSTKALAAIKSADANLAVVLKALEAKGARETTDLFIASDHGFSTIARSLDLAGLLRKDGFSIVQPGGTAAATGDIRVVGNGGTVFFHVNARAPETIARLVQWLQGTDFAGVIFSREKLAGTFPLSQIHLETDAGPDVALAFRWNNRRNADGVAGMIDANGAGAAHGTHGTLSRFDVHNVLVAAGPHFRRGVRSYLPSSNLDVAASIVHLLGLEPAQPLDGRVLTEALRNGTAPAAAEATKEEAKAGKWRQYLRTSKVGDSIYVDEGNGGEARD